MESTLLDEDDILMAIDRVAQQFHWGAPKALSPDPTISELVYHGLWLHFASDLQGKSGEEAIDAITQLLETRPITAEDLVLNALAYHELDVDSPELQEGVGDYSRQILRDWTNGQHKSPELRQPFSQHRR